MRAFFLQLQKDIREALCGYLLAEPAVADIVVLAVYAAQRTAGKKHRTAAACAADAGLLPKVKRSARGFDFTAAAAKAGFDISIYAALPWAEAAGIDRKHGIIILIQRFKVYPSTIQSGLSSISGSPHGADYLVPRPSPNPAAEGSPINMDTSDACYPYLMLVFSEHSDRAITGGFWNNTHMPSIYYMLTIINICLVFCNTFVKYYLHIWRLLMDIYKKIDKLCEARGWTKYELCKRANISQTTLSASRKRNNDPSISTLEAVCAAFGITLSQFFSESNIPLDLTDEQKELLEHWSYLPDKQKKILYELIKNI